MARLGLMRSSIPWMLGLVIVLADACAAKAVAQAKLDSNADASLEKEDAEPAGPSGTSNYATESIRGRVVWMADALKERIGVQVVPEARERVLALQTAEGRLYPIIEDLRGQSFRKDERLRQMDLELLVRRYKKVPMIQIVRIYEHRKDGKYIVDYWCDVCAIVMFEYGPCSCCQDQNQMRKRLVADSP